MLRPHSIRDTDQSRTRHAALLEPRGPEEFEHRCRSSPQHIPRDDGFPTMDDPSHLIEWPPPRPGGAILIPRRTEKLMPAYTRGQHEFPARHSLFEPARRRDVGIPEEGRPSGRIEPPKRRMNSLKRFLRGPYCIDRPIEHAFKLVRLIDNFPDTVGKLLGCKPVQDDRRNSHFTFKIFNARLSLHKTRHKLQSGRVDLSPHLRRPSSRHRSLRLAAAKPVNKGLPPLRDLQEPLPYRPHLAVNPWSRHILNPSQKTGDYSDGPRPGSRYSACDPRSGNISDPRQKGIDL